MATFELSWSRSLRNATRTTNLRRQLLLAGAALFAGLALGTTVAAHPWHSRAAAPLGDDITTNTEDLLLPRELVARVERWNAGLVDDSPPLAIPPGLPPFNAEARRYAEELRAALVAEAERERAAPPAPAPAEGHAGRGGAGAAAAPAAPPAPAAPESAPAPTSASKPNFYVPSVSHGPATDLERRLFEAMNAERAKAGLPPLAYDAGLTVIARTRVRQMVDQGYFGHVDPYGYRMYVELLAHFGYTWYAWAGENLAMNNYAVSESPERAMVALMNSPSHRANILSTAYSRVGIGELSTADGRHFYAMIFLG